MDDQTQSRIQTQFQARHSLWTSQCGLLSFSPLYILSDNLIPPDTPYQERMILSQVSHPQHLYNSFHILVVYAPARNPPTRRTFFASVLAIINHPQLHINPQQLIIAGDFNYSYLRPRLTANASTEWLVFLEGHMYDSMHNNGMHTIPTFQHPSLTPSTLDYIFLSKDTLTHHPISNTIDKMKPDWTDHNMLTITLAFKHIPIGPGLWKANPILLQNADFRSKLDTKLDQLAESMQSGSSPQATWDALKLELKKWIRTQGRRLANQRSTKLRDLQQQRIDIIQCNQPNDHRLEQLSTIDPIIHQLQQDSTDIAALKAGISWREKGETSPGYLKRLHQRRTMEQFINALSSTDTRTFPTNPSTTLDIAHGFYQHLYTADPVPKVNISQYLRHIPRSSMLSPDQQSILSKPITEEDIQVQVNRSTKASSPGADGLGYPYLAHLYRHSRIKPLMTKISSFFPKYQVLNLLSPTWLPVFLVDT